MTKGDVFGASEDVIFFPKIRGLRGNSKTLNTDPYRVIPLFQGFDKIIRIGQNKSLELKTIQNGGHLN